MNQIIELDGHNLISKQFEKRMLLAGSILFYYMLHDVTASIAYSGFKLKYYFWAVVYCFV